MLLLPVLASGGAAAAILLSEGKATETANGGADPIRRETTCRSIAVYAWLFLIAGGAALWPPDLQARPCSFSTWWIGSAVVGSLVMLSRMLGVGEPALNRWASAWMWLMLLAGGVHTAWYWGQSLSDLGGVDSFYFWCYARDMSQGVAVSSDAYRYFPGFYLVLRNVFAVAGPTMTAAQIFHGVLLGANAGMAGLLVWRATKHAEAAVLAGLWCGVLATRFQGLEGGVEPLATLPMLAALAWWNGRVLRGSRGVRDALVLGIGIGASMFCKQQAGLLALGALSCVGGLGTRLDASQRHQWRALLIMPLAAAGSCLGLLALEGLQHLTADPANLWTPLREGLRMAAGYPSQGGPLLNFYVLLRTDESAALALVMLLLAAVWAWRRHTTQPWTRTVHWLTCAVLAVGVQFISRPYGHYALLGAPLLTAAVMIAAVQVWRRLPQTTQADALSRLLLMAAAAFPLCYVTTNTEAFTVWRFQQSYQSKLWASDEQAAEDLSVVQRWVRGGRLAYVAPSRHAELYFRLGLRGWAPRLSLRNTAYRRRTLGPRPVGADRAGQLGRFRPKMVAR